jgi:hypothetical protein
MRIFWPFRSSGVATGFLVYRLREPPSIQPRATSGRAGGDLVQQFLPIGPSITARMWASSRKTKGMLNTLTSGTTGPIGPSEMRAIWIAPICACSIISFSLPSTPPGNICSLMRRWSRPPASCPCFPRPPRWGSRPGARRRPSARSVRRRAMATVKAAAATRPVAPAIRVLRKFMLVSSRGFGVGKALRKKWMRVQAARTRQGATQTARRPAAGLTGPHRRGGWT